MRNKLRLGSLFRYTAEEKRRGRRWLRHQAAMRRWKPWRESIEDSIYCPKCLNCGYVECCGVACRGGVGCVHLFTPFELKHRNLINSKKLSDRQKFFDLLEIEEAEQAPIAQMDRASDSESEGR